MSGQVSVTAIPTDRRRAFENGLSAAGVAFSQSLIDEDVRPILSRGATSITIEVYEHRPGETLVVVPHGPYTVNPWSWRAGVDLFDDITAILESVASFQSAKMER